MNAADPQAVERSAIRKVSWRLVPFVALMFFINFLDRTAISFAGPNGMSKDLGLSAAQFGLAAGVFFIGYIVLEIPSNLALHRFGARRWLARIMVTWGIVALLFTWVSSIPGLYTLRFLLGVAEAGFFPGAILFLSMWVPARHRSHILALFYLAQPLTIVIGAPVAALLIEAHGAFGLAGWRIMFFGVAIPAILVGVIAWFYLADRPSQAKLALARRAELAHGEARGRGTGENRFGPTAHAASRRRDDERPRLDVRTDVLRPDLWLVRAGVLPADDHRRLRGALRYALQRLPEGDDHCDSLPAGRGCALPLEPQRDQARRARLAHRHPGAGRRG